MRGNNIFYSFLWLIGVATITTIIGIIIGHSVGSYDRQYKSFEDYQYQQYLESTRY